MDTFMKADIFFFVTTIAVALVSLGLLIMFVYVVRFMRTCNRIAKSVEERADEIGEDVGEMIEDVRESFLFRLMFPKAKRKKSGKRK
jgi:hypothetical protein